MKRPLNEIKSIYAIYEILIKKNETYRNDLNIIYVSKYIEKLRISNQLMLDLYKLSFLHELFEEISKSFWLTI